MKKINRPYLNFTLAVCAIVALYLVSQNWKNQLVLQDVKIYDASILTDDEVKALANVRTGSSLFGLSLSQISYRVEQNPFVKKAVVVRALPYDLTITVHERTPLALLATPTSMLSVDESGIVLPLPLERKNNLPIITNISGILSVGDTVKGSLMQAVKFLSDAEKGRASAQCKYRRSPVTRRQFGCFHDSLLTSSGNWKRRFREKTFVFAGILDKDRRCR